MKNKLMAAGVVVSVVLSMYSASTSSKTRSIAAQVERQSNETYWNQFNMAEAFNNAVSTTNKLSLLNTIKTMVKELDDELGREINDRRALEAVVENNAKELIRISGNLERDVDKMYTNIVMFGASVFDVRNDMADMALRIQDLERKAFTPAVPTVPAAVVPAPEQTQAEKFIEKFNIGPADLGPAPGAEGGAK
jgi:hypothetical protein